jgi:type II secretory pathway predicted ATPase ExeA
MAHSTALSEGIPFGLRCKPFQPTADPAFFFPGGQYGAALEQIVDCLGARRGACLLTGEPGTGKTIVLRRVLDELAASNSFVPMSTNAPLHLDDLVWLLGDRVASSTAARSGQTPWDDVPSLLRGLADAGRPVALAIDEAQALDDAMFGQLAPLVETGALASLLLVGQPALVPRLEAWAAQGLEIAVHCSLDPLRFDEVGAYIAHRCRKAGCAAGDLFSSEAVERIASVSGGVPRLVNLLGSAALATGERQGARRVEPNIVDDVAAELGLVASVTSARPVGTPPGDPPRPTPRPARANNRPSASREGLPPKHVPLAGMTAAALIAGAVAMLLVLPLLPRTSPTAPPASNVPAPSPSDRAGAPPAADPSGPASESTHAQVTEPSGVSQATEGTATGELPTETPSPDPRVPDLPPFDRPSRTSGVPRTLPRFESPSGGGRTTAARRSSTPQAAFGEREKDEVLLRKVETRDVPGVRAALAAGASPDATDRTGLTALMLAVIHGDPTIVGALLDAGASVDARNNAGQTALIMAAINNNRAVARTLLARGADVNARTSSGWTALMYAAWKGQPEMTRLLLDHGADPSLRDGSGWTARRYAAWQVGEPTSTDGEGGTTRVDKNKPSAQVGPGHFEVLKLLTEPRRGQ